MALFPGTHSPFSHLENQAAGALSPIVNGGLHMSPSKAALPTCPRVFPRISTLPLAKKVLFCVLSLQTSYCPSPRC